MEQRILVFVNSSWEMRSLMEMILICSKWLGNGTEVTDGTGILMFINSSWDLGCL